MKIVHLCLACFFPDNYSYQENMLPKFHKKLGFDVEVIASLDTFDSAGKPATYKGELKYINENGILVTRLKYKWPSFIYKKMKRFIGLKKALDKAKPDIIFVHGCQFLDSSILKNYVKKNRVVMYVDNHADFNNSAKNVFSRLLLHKIIWKNCAQSLEKYTKKFYGVLPVRTDFLINTYHLPKNKCETLLMGADPEIINRATSLSNIIQQKQILGIKADDFIIVTGGKIDSNKPQVLILMKAIKEFGPQNIKLFIFGSIDTKMLKEFQTLLCDRIIYVGWKTKEEIYNILCVADLACYPGLHSVLWEQTVATGVPCIFRNIEGTKHIDLGGNCLFFKEDNPKSYFESIMEAKSIITNMKFVAVEKGMKHFSYLEIAKKSIEVEAK